MSAREWRPGEFVDSRIVGDLGTGAVVAPSHGLRGWALRAWTPGREMTDTGVPSLDEAKALASEWLDRREAEAQQAQKGGTT